MTSSVVTQATEIVLPGKVEPTGLQVRTRDLPTPAAGQKWSCAPTGRAAAAPSPSTAVGRLSSPSSLGLRLFRPWPVAGAAPREP